MKCLILACLIAIALAVNHESDIVRRAQCTTDADCASLTCHHGGVEHQGGYCHGPHMNNHGHQAAHGHCTCHVDSSCQTDTDCAGFCYNNGTSVCHHNHGHLHAGGHCTHCH